MTTKNFENNNASLPPDTPVGPAYDSERVDTPVGPEYDSEKGLSSSCPLYSLSSSCLTRGSTKQQCRIAESGRSMVEMLGTLAIIGVLSIGGIAGYSYGMDKYRANETLKDINLRVVDLLTQASQGREALSLAEWDKEETLYDFANPAYVEGENLIAFDIGTTKKLPKSVCQMVFDGLANTAVQIDINAVHANSNETCGTDNTMTFYFEGGSNGTGGETPTGEQCGDTVCGICETCGCDVDAVGALSLCDALLVSCVTVDDYEMACTTGGKTGWCVSGACEPDTTCNCEAGQYCKDQAVNECTPHPSGTCIDLDYRTTTIDGTTYYISKNVMNWWDGMSFCKALGKNMLKVTDLTEDYDYTGGLSYSYTMTSLGLKLKNDVFNEENNPWVLLNNKGGEDCSHLRFGFDYSNVSWRSNLGYEFVVCK